MIMRTVCKIALLFFIVDAVSAAPVPSISFFCTSSIGLHIDKAGKAYINAKEAKLNIINDSAYEVMGSGATVAVSINADGTKSATYLDEHGAKGVCKNAGLGE
jgi:hypothetical protein